MTQHGYRHPFLVGTSYLGGVGDIPRTILDLALSRLSYLIRRTEPDWYPKYSLPSFRDHWISKAKEHPWIVESGTELHTVSLTDKQISFVLDELEGYACLRDDKYRCQVSCFERIWESTSHLLPIEAECSFKKELALLQDNVTATRPPEDDQVTTTLVDPSAACFRYNATLVRDPSRPPRALPPPEQSEIYTLSSKFALLPSEVQVTSDSAETFPKVRFLSYITDLDRSYTNLYASLSQVMRRFIPMFEHTLTDLHRNNPLASLRTPGHPSYTEWDEPEEPDHSDDEEGWRRYEVQMRTWVLDRPIKLPDVPYAGYQGGLEHRNSHVLLRNRTVKVIVRIEVIQLSAAHPTYPGQSFHIEGMRNERVVATGIYIPVMTNIRNASINFRMAVTYPRGFAAGDVGATLRGWGLRDGSPCNQGIGSVPLHEGIALSFPNIYQYQLGPFTISDPSEKPAKMTVVSFLLIDPDLPEKDVLTTRQVPPQDVHWIRKALDESLDSSIPSEILDRIIELVVADRSCWALDADGINETRQAVRQERSEFARRSDLFHFLVPFDVWHGPYL